MIVSDITGFRELVSGGSEAVLVPKDDPDAWAAEIVALLSNEPERRRMRIAGLAKSAEFAWPRVTEQIFGVYRKVLQC
jgi:glycosyltransferase involved in cell wall biosynthesis